MGDEVVFDFDGYVDGVAFAGGKSENYELKLDTAKKEILSTYGESYWRESVYYEFAIYKILDRANLVYAN